MSGGGGEEGWRFSPGGEGRERLYCDKRETGLRSGGCSISCITRQLLAGIESLSNVTGTYT